MRSKRNCLTITKRSRKRSTIKCAICQQKVHSIFTNQKTCTDKKCRRTYEIIIKKVFRLKYRLLKEARLNAG